MRRQRTTLIGLGAAAIVSCALVPLAVSVVRRSRQGDYTQTPEFQAFVAGYLI